MKLLFTTLLAIATLSVSAQNPTGFTDHEVSPAQGNSSPEHFIAFNGKLCFYASNGTSGKELFMLDTATGTAQIVQNINPVSASSLNTDYRRPLAVVDNKLYFTANNGSSGDELFEYDGSNQPKLVFDITFNSDSSAPDDYTEYNGKLYYNAYTPSFGREMYAYTPGTSTPQRITDVNLAGMNSVFGPMAVYDNKIYYAGVDTNYGSELWYYDPVQDTARIVADIDTGINSGNPANMTVIGSKLYFSAYDAYYGRELYEYDGTTVKRITDINTGAFSSISPVSTNPFVLYNGKIYFTGRDANTEQHTYTYDPATGNVALAFKVNSNGTSAPRDYVLYDGEIYFSASDGTNGFELFRYDGTDVELVGDLCKGSGLSLPLSLFVFGDYLFFSATNCVNSGTELFSYNVNKGVGIQQIELNADVKAYPNPVQDVLNINVSVDKPTTLLLTVTNLYGQKVYTSRAQSNTTTANYSVPMSNQPAGVYIYHISNEDGTTLRTGKVIKQ